MSGLGSSEDFTCRVKSGASGLPPAKSKAAGRSARSTLARSRRTCAGLLTLVLFWRLRGQEKYLSLFGGHVSAEEFLEAHQDFVWGHGYFPARFLDLDHATTLTRVRMTRCSKLNRGGDFSGWCTDRSEWERMGT